MTKNEQAYEQALNEGHSAAWDQDWGKAVACYRRALHEWPDQPKALNSLGLALFQLSEFFESLQAYQRVAQLTPDDPIPWEKVAQLSERLGDIEVAVDAASRAAEGYLAQRDVNKAMENWTRVTALKPENAVAHSRLAMVHEKLGHKQQAVNEYLSVASLLQRAGSAAKAQEVVSRALTLMPMSPEARQAQSMLKTGQLLPAPARPKGGTGPLRMAQIKQLQEPMTTPSAKLDPVAEATQKALTRLADILFDYSEENVSRQERPGMAEIVKGTGPLSMQNAEQAKVVLHLGQAIDAQTKGEDAAAADELERALDAGFDHAALHFDLGYLRLKGDRRESAIRHLAKAVKHEDYGLATKLLLGDLLYKKEVYKDASLEYLEALKLADSMTVAGEQADEVREMYEPLIESQREQKDPEACRRLCENVRALLVRPDWREQLSRTREQMQHDGGAQAAPVAEMMLAAQNSGVIESINRVHELARAGKLRSAMDEAYGAVHLAPLYLPLHSLIGEILLQDNRMEDAITKFSVVAHAYGVRGEVAQASKLWRRILQLAPMDMSARTRLIDLLLARGQVDDAIHEYLELADIYYRLADLDMARQTFTTALRAVQQANGDRSWNVQILQRMADIDMQRLDWKQAIRVLEQIRTLRPDDQGARRQLVELHSRMGQAPQASAELDSYLTYLESNSRSAEAIPFLEDLVREHEGDAFFRRALAAQLHLQGRTPEAVAQLDALGEALLQQGKKDEALEVISQIVAMDPPNAGDYRQLLSQIGH